MTSDPSRDETSDQTESEFKLRAYDRVETASVDASLRALGAPSTERASRGHVDTYLDDELGTLARRGVGLRLRETDEQRLLTCKLRGSVGDGLHVRREVEARWRRATPPRRTGELPAEFSARLRPELPDCELRPWLRLTVAREVRVLTVDGADICEVAVDSVTAAARGRRATFQEIELEVLHDLAAVRRIAAALQARLPVELVTDDKPTYAAAALGL